MLKSYFYSVLRRNDLDLGFSAVPMYREPLNPAERKNEIRHPINLRLSNWRVQALVVVILYSTYRLDYDTMMIQFVRLVLR